MRCGVYGCNNDNQAKNKDPTIHFYSFPKKDSIKKLWINACCRADNFNSATARICSRHFVSDDYERNLQHELLNYQPKKGPKLKPDVIPSLNLPKLKKLSTSQIKRGERFERRSRKNFAQEISCNRVNQEKSDLSGIATSEEAYSQPSTSASVQEEYITIGVNTEEVMSEELKTLQEESKKLKEKIANLEASQMAVQRIFSSRQIRNLQYPKAHPIWSVEEVSQAIAVHSAGPKAYRLLLKKGFPFPAVSTLRGWTKLMEEIKKLKK